MAAKNVNVRVLQVVKTTAEWAAAEVASVVLEKGLLGVEVLTTGQTKIKIGDGVHTWSELDYIAANVDSTDIPVATDVTLGGIKVGSNLDIDEAVLSAKTLVGATEDAYTLLTEQPEDWTTNYTNYFTYDSATDQYSAVTGGSAPTFATDTYYALTAAANGTAGYVPAPTTADVDSVLTGDGVWTPFSDITFTCTL
jgi:hypothetical protein